MTDAARVSCAKTTTNRGDVVRFKIERVGGSKAMQSLSQICSNCTVESKCRKREFSVEAWTVLVIWNEVQAAAVDQPLCDECYNELRETLIDRASDVAEALLVGAGVKTAGGSKHATPGHSKVRRAS